MYFSKISQLFKFPNIKIERLKIQIFEYRSTALLLREKKIK